MLLDEIAHSVRAMSCVLDGEIVSLAPDGRSLFNRLLPARLATLRRLRRALD
jgi:ATP-dependent DNA ligase